MREHCRAVFSEVAAIQKMSPEQIKALTTVPASDWESCRRISGEFSSPSQESGGTGPAPAPSGATPPTPIPTPLPPELPVGPQSLAPDTPDPPTIGSSYAGLGASAPASSGATPPTPLPHVQMGIPVTPPPGWVPKQWADLRARCQEIADKAAAHRPFTRGDWSTAGVCGSLGVQPPPPPNGYPSPISSGVSAPIVTPEATPAVTAGPSWCTDAPASPPPPGFERRPGDWANVRKMCGAHMYDRGCMRLCAFAEELWRRKRAGQLNQPNTAPSPSDQPQGPFPLPGGASGYILPARPAPVPSDPTSDATDALSAELVRGVPAPGFSAALRMMESRPI